MYMHMLFSPQGLNVADLEDLLEDIEIYRKIEKDTNQEFWMVRSAYMKNPYTFAEDQHNRTQPKCPFLFK